MAVAAPAAAAASAKEFAKEAHGFELVQQQFVREYDSHVLMYKHKKTGGAQQQQQQQLACTPHNSMCTNHHTDTTVLHSLGVAHCKSQRAHQL
jgi:hypothetical protein